MKTADDVLLEALAEPAPTRDAPPTGPPAGPPPIGDDGPALPRSRLLIAAGLATSSLAWMLGGIFDGSLARILGVAAVWFGVVIIGLAARASSSTALEFLLLPGAFLTAAAAAIALPNQTGADGTVPELVGRAIRNGGLLEPPVPFDPGWRFLVLFLLAVAAGASASFALSWRRPLLVPAIPIPFVLGAGLLQADGNELISGLVSLLLVVASMMVVYTAQMAGEGGGVGRFELRQVARGGGALLAVALLVAGLSRIDALFPDSDRIIQPRPQKPTIVPLDAVKDEVLFRVDSQAEGPWRLGVLDEYAEDTWLLPPLEPSRLTDPGGADATGGLAPSGSTIDATFTIQEMEGLSLPALANLVATTDEAIRQDTRTQVLRVTGSSPGRGYSYRVTAAAPPSGPELAAARGAIPPDLTFFTRLPPAPAGVEALLSRAPGNPWERLQFLRAELYGAIVAAGSGVPVPLPPARVEELLTGADATPFEITAAEVMLARWAGIPARIGYGFYRGEQTDDGWEVRPKHGANWIEAWFPGHGWVPVIGVPPRARASLTASAKRDVLTRPSDELTLQVYLPLKQQNPLLLYVIVRYWIAVTLPFVLAGLLLWFFSPGIIKPIRSRMRRRWANHRGPGEQVAVAYAEFRDAANDLNAGHPYDTPLEFVGRIADDEEHLELAWLVTRAVWGDLTRGLSEADADAATEMSRSLRRRLARAQTPLTRLLAVASRASLREPFDPSLPNPWPRRHARGRLRRLGQAVRARVPWSHRRRLRVGAS